ncbi:MAG: hypothetical protein JWM57_3644 [Phycisphaerales bacterium]|nr:hypothetical protein [Phycisphaerales bacterium]
MARVHPSLLLIAAITASALADPADLSTLKENGPVSVREGDAWSTATFTRKEGRKYLVKYDDGTEEWVTADRLKLGPVTDNPADKAGPATKPALKTPAKPAFAVGELVEFKWGGLWRKCKITEKRGDWTLIEITGWNGRYEWVEPWRLRKEGSSYDTEYAHPNSQAKRADPPPRPTPGDSPAKAETASGKGPGSPFAPPESGNPITEAKRGSPTIAAFAETWAYTPAAVRKMQAGPTVLPPLSDIFTHYNRVTISGTTAMVGITGERPGSPAQTGIIKVNLSAGTGLGVQMNAASLPLGLSPSGNLIVARSNGFHGGTSSRLDLYKIAGQKTTPVISFVPDPNNSDISDAMFIDEGHVLTLSNGMLAAWDISNATQQWQLPTSDKAFARAADGKTIAVMTDDGVAIVDPAAGKVLGVCAGEVREISFSGDGQRLLGLKDNVLTVWNLADGKVLFNLGLTPGIGGINAPLTGLDSHFALVGSYLISLDKKLPIWKYEGGTGYRTVAGGRVFTVNVRGARDNNIALVSADLPHAAAQQAARAAPEPVMVLKPGVSVSLDLQHEATDAQKQATTAALTRKLNAAGITVAPGQPVRVVTRTEAGKSESREYETRMGFDRNRETVTISSKITTISIQSGPTVCWSRSWEYHNDPGMLVSLQKGETVQSKADAARNTYDGVAKIDLPTLVAAPVNLDTLPVSQWALGGVKDQ